MNTTTTDLNNQLEIKISRTRLTIISSILIITVMYFAKTLLLPILFAIFISLLLNPVVCLLRRIYLPRSLASILSVIALVACIVAVLSLISVPAEKWISKVPEITEEIKEKINQAASPFENGEEKPWYVLKRDEKSPVSEKFYDQATVFVASVLASATPVILVQSLTVIVLVLFFLVYGEGLYRNIISAMPKFSHKRLSVVIGRAIQLEVSNYVFIISFINLCLGATTTIVLYLLGLEDALLWGVLAALLNYIPYVGPFVMTILLSFVSIFQFGVEFSALKYPLAFLIVNFIECQIITPTVLGDRLRINPLIVVLWLFLVGWLWGVFGMVLAVPILVSIKIMVNNLDQFNTWKSILR